MKCFNLFTLKFYRDTLKKGSSKKESSSQVSEDTNSQDNLEENLGEVIDENLITLKKDHYNQKKDYNHHNK